jgi:hypothetical protein
VVLATHAWCDVHNVFLVVQLCHKKLASQSVLLLLFVGQVVLPLDTAARRLLRLGLVQVADSPMTDAESAAVLQQARPASSSSNGTNGTAASSSSSSSSSSKEQGTWARDSSDASWVLLQASPIALSAVPVDQAVKILDQQWQQRLQVAPTGSQDAAASYAQLKQRLCDTATPELWEWVEQEAQVALADMGVTSSLSPAGRRSKRGGSLNGNGANSSTHSADSSRAATPAAAAAPVPGGALLAASTTTSNSSSSNGSSSSTGTTAADRSWVARAAGHTAPYHQRPRALKQLTAQQGLHTAVWGRRQAVARPPLRLLCS